MHNVRMERLRALLNDEFAGSGVRFVVSGTIVAAVYLGIPIGLSSVGIPIEVAIPIAYVVAATLHFNLQRRFVFRHVPEFALTTRQQISRYVVMGAVQYPVTALLTALLPKALGVSQNAAFVGVACSWSVFLFLTLRSHVFHGTDSAAGVSETAQSTQSEVLQEQLVWRGGRGRDGQVDSVDARAEQHRNPDLVAVDARDPSATGA